MKINHTPMRAAMLAEVAASEPGENGLALHCVNYKRAIWKPVRLDLDLELKLSAAESRATTDLWHADAVDTPDWQGDMDVYRTLQITAVGRELLSEWSRKDGETP